MKKRPSKNVFSREQLEKMYTKQLLNRLRFFYRLWKRGVYEPTKIDHCGDRYIWYSGTEEQAITEKAAIKEILATREHIPNKQESRLKRQNKKPLF